MEVDAFVYSEFTFFQVYEGLNLTPPCSGTPAFVGAVRPGGFALFLSPPFHLAYPLSVTH